MPYTAVDARSGERIDAKYCSGSKIWRKNRCQILQWIQDLEKE
jgi:hypothetical protein